MAFDQNAPKVGADPVEVQTSEAIKTIPPNKTMLVLPYLRQDAPEKPQPAVRCRTIDEAFEQFEPKKEVEFLMEDGTPYKEMLVFMRVSDFTSKGLISQSKFLNELDQKKEQYKKIAMQLKTNERLKKALSDKAAKQNILLVLQAFIQKLEDADLS